MPRSDPVRDLRETQLMKGRSLCAKSQRRLTSIAAIISSIDSTRSGCVSFAFESRRARTIALRDCSSA